MSIHFDVDSQLHELEMEWRLAYETSIVARADYQSLALSSAASAELLDMARERLDRAEALKARMMVKIERREDQLLGEE
jgi:hypothetical protein